MEKIRTFALAAMLIFFSLRIRALDSTLHAITTTSLSQEGRTETRGLVYVRTTVAVPVQQSGGLSDMHREALVVVLTSLLGTAPMQRTLP